MALLLRVSLFLFLFLFLAAPAVSRAGISFNQDIRPILADACFHCHGPDPGTRKASLRFDTEAGFFDPASGPTVIKGNPEQSPLYQRLISTDPDEIMPPPESHKVLKPSEIALLKTWIAEGAPWQPHWSLITPSRPALPPVRKTDWVRTPIDAFVLARLETEGLEPAPVADPYTLIRRVSLDLTGLPPTPEFVARFLPTPPATTLSDSDYSRLIDELLKSPDYGVHRARYWLDAARYADTHGLHFDKPREMWPYRDWVVRSFNRNQPFDQFTLEQIAGDLLPEPTEDQLIATGLQRCNITTNEGGTIDEENLANYAADRVQTLGWVYLGLTTNCAQCHDHKFDPITQRDYYALAAFFRNTTQKPKDGNVKDGLGPILVLPTDSDRPRWQALPSEITAAKTRMQESRKLAGLEFEQWLTTAKPEDLDRDVPTQDLVTHLPLNEGQGKEVSNTCVTAKTVKAVGEVSWSPDGKIGPAPVLKSNGTFDLGDVGDFEKDQPFSFGAWVRASKVGQNAGILARMDEKAASRGWDLYQNDRSYSIHLVSTWPADAIKVSTRKPSVRPGVWQHLFVTYDGSGIAQGIKLFIDGVDTELSIAANTLKGSIRTTTPTRIGQRSHAQVFHEGRVQDVRLYARKLTPVEIQTIGKVGPLREMLTAKKHGPKQKEALFDHYLLTRNTDYQAANTLSQKLEAEQTAIRARSPLTHIQEEKPDTQPMANILMRGAYDKPGDQVVATVPVALGQLPPNAPQNRLGLAQWMVSENNPLTARVTVNRMWQELFGSGLVKTSEDFGIMGTAPTHSELLDWLAVEFRETGWDVKRFYKMLLSSATYRQAALTTTEKIEKDRNNDFLSRGPRFRMDAEMIRDYALRVSGTLSQRLGGPGTMPYQPENIWEVVGLGTEKYTQDKGENLYRRTLYNFWKRMAHSPNMDIFNAPSREVCAVRRDRTNTPLQALVTLNDIQFVEAARRLAEKLLQTHSNTKDAEDALLNDMSLHILCRPLRPNEKDILKAAHRDLLAHYQSQPTDATSLIAVGDAKASDKVNPSELAAWTMVCNQMMNLDEALNK